ncbi:sialoadhesin-like [Takifugu rubripes]|uniref:sialoadhesin-like n=1 Tax=Takifugu rubripes TaxID=31033 RepID=UPI001145CBDA|nr:sialoadhesin-like [Takifugu rubripes]
MEEKIQKKRELFAAARAGLQSCLWILSFLCVLCFLQPCVGAFRLLCHPSLTKFKPCTAFNSEDQDQMSREFHGRTALFGQITNGDCSLKIERIRMDDARVFEVALKRADDFLWGKPRRFNLDVVDTPEAPIISGMLAATEGQLVSVNCSVNYYCPSRPPILQWIWERGDQLNITKPPEIQTVFPEHHRPLMLASLSFTVSHRVKPRLRCEASYPGAKALTASKDLHVTFSPKDVAVQVESKIVKEGGRTPCGLHM